ncbi:hypothetical protein LTR53_012615 [Teratosphaeriaceae sp. CCFEE 6253]|nr:hypothetical protein LTR53_012615 [Teratosphaeriaceae sp. CCFEE 6253]
MTQFHHKVQEEKSYRRAIFLAVSLALAGYQGKGQAEQQGGTSGAEGRGRRGVGAVTPPAGPTSLPLPAAHRSRTGPSPPALTSFFGEAFRQARELPPQTLRRGSGDVSGEPRSAPSGSYDRSRSGSGSPSTPPRSPTAEAVPPQLLGGRAGPNANVLKEGLPDTSLKPLKSAEFTTAYHNSRKASAAVRLQDLLSPDRVPRPNLQSTAEHVDEGADSPPRTPTSGNSSQSKTSKTSKTSATSSFAYLLRNDRADTRLLNKRSQPIAHLVQQDPLSRNPPVPQRTPSYYQPKVVEDTLIGRPPAALTHEEPPKSSLTVAEFFNAAEASSIPAVPPPPRSPSPARRPKPLRVMRSHDSQRTSDSAPSPLPSPLPFPPGPAMTTRPGMQRTLTSRNISKPLPPPPPQLQSGSIKRPFLTARESTKPSAARPTHLTLPLPQPNLEDSPEHKRYHDITPPELEPTTPKHFRHGDHYFRTFGHDTVYMKAFTPTMIPTTPTASQQSSSPPPSPLPGPLTRTMTRVPSDPAVSGPHKRKRSSIFRLFRKTALTDSTYVAPRSGIVGTRPPRPPITPGISVSPPYEPESMTRRLEQTSSEMSLPPYFAQPICPQQSAALATPSPLTSPMGTRAESPPPPHRFGNKRTLSQRSSESPTSPMSQPRQRRPRLRHQAILEDIVDADLSNRERMLVVPSGPVAGPQLALKPGDSKGCNGAGPAGKSAVRWVSDEARDVTLSHEDKPGAELQGKARSIFQRFFLELRHSASVTSLPDEADTPGSFTPGRRASLVPRGSLAKMVTSRDSMASLVAIASKTSLNKLKKKASQATAASSYQEPKERPEVRVTNFQQTPYGQRVANTRRTELSQVKAFVEQALNDDDDDTMLGFELNVPEHLPGSPLCPLSPKHKSGGKAICPIHGRRKPRRSVAAKAAKGAASRNRGPRIVYEGSAEGTGERMRQIAAVDGVQSLRSVSGSRTWYA